MKESVQIDESATRDELVRVVHDDEDAVLVAVSHTLQSLFQTEDHLVAGALSEVGEDIWTKPSLDEPIDEFSSEKRPFLRDEAGQSCQVLRQRRQLCVVNEIVLFFQKKHFCAVLVSYRKSQATTSKSHIAVAYALTFSITHRMEGRTCPTEWISKEVIRSGEYE